MKAKGRLFMYLLSLCIAMLVVFLAVTGSMFLALTAHAKDPAEVKVIGTPSAFKLPPDSEGFSKPYLTQTTITVKFGSEAFVKTSCQNPYALGCAEMIKDQCTIYTLEPRGFKDNCRLAVLGHEVLHCLGAAHQQETHSCNE